MKGNTRQNLCQGLSAYMKEPLSVMMMSTMLTANLDVVLHVDWQHNAVEEVSAVAGLPLNRSLPLSTCSIAVV